MILREARNQKWIFHINQSILWSFSSYVLGGIDMESFHFNSKSTCIGRIWFIRTYSWGEPTMESVIWHFVCKWSIYFFHLLTCRGVVESLEEDTRVWRSSEYCSNLYVDYDLSQKFIGKSLPRFNNVRAMCNHKRGLSDLEKLKATYVHTGGRFQV